jgi:hypothetical protein
LADGSSRLFKVACKSSQHTLVSVERLRDPEIAVITDHLGACCPAELLGEAPMLGDVMARVRVVR